MFYWDGPYIKNVFFCWDTKQILYIQNWWTIPLNINILKSYEISVQLVLQYPLLISVNEFYSKFQILHLQWNFLSHYSVNFSLFNHSNLKYSELSQNIKNRLWFKLDYITKQAFFYFLISYPGQSFWYDFISESYLLRTYMGAAI